MFQDPKGRKFYSVIRVTRQRLWGFNKVYSFYENSK